MRWFPVAFLANGVLKVTHGGIELTIPVLRVRMLNHYATTLSVSLRDLIHLTRPIDKLPIQLLTSSSSSPKRNHMCFVLPLQNSASGSAYIYFSTFFLQRLPVVSQSASYFLTKARSEQDFVCFSFAVAVIRDLCHLHVIFQCAALQLISLACGIRLTSICCEISILPLFSP